MSQRRILKRSLDLSIYLLSLSTIIFLMVLILRLGLGLPAMWTPEVVEAQSLPSLTVSASPVVTLTPTVTATLTPTPLPTATPLPAGVPPTPYPTPQPRAYLIVGETGVNVRSGPSTHYPKLGLLAPGARVGMTGHFAGWWRISHDDAPAWVSGEVVTAFHGAAVPEVTVDLPLLDSAPAVIPAPQTPVEIEETRWIDVDLSDQRLTAYEDGVPVKTYRVSTGLPQTPTPEGQFRIWIKLRFDDMAGADYYIEDVPWVMYFYQGYGFHGVTWHANFGHPMSHGCVNQPNEMAEWLFNFAEVGTLVNIHE